MAIVSVAVQLPAGRSEGRVDWLGPNVVVYLALILLWPNELSRW